MLAASASTCIVSAWGRLVCAPMCIGLLSNGYTHSERAVKRDIPEGFSEGYPLPAGAFRHDLWPYCGTTSPAHVASPDRCCLI